MKNYLQFLNENPFKDQNIPVGYTLGMLTGVLGALPNTAYRLAVYPFKLENL